MAQVINPPLAISLVSRLVLGGLAEAAAIAVAALRGADLPPIARWSVPNTARRKKVAPGNLPRELAPAGAASEHATATMELQDGSIGSLFLPCDENEWTFSLDALLPKNDPERAPRILAALRTVCRTLLTDPRVTRVSLAFQGAGALCIPIVPIAGDRTYLVSCTRREVAEAYEAPDVFWSSGWDATEWIGERAMVERGMHTLGSVDYLAEVEPRQWALARAARPHRCEYALPVVQPEEQEIYRAGSPALSLVGYADAEREVELSCALRPPARVQGYEVFDLFGLLQAGVLQDGRPVRGVRVVFAYEDMARAERRPLLDVGVSVLFYDALGNLQELTD
ncbi:MAG TPA: hypothetical protein VKB79_27170 [Bryobacteraceae bacterium]|nr:hypothetical protein [Bryobacteraceae bacterium]